MGMDYCGEIFQFVNTWKTLTLAVRNARTLSRHLLRALNWPTKENVVE